MKLLIDEMYPPAIAEQLREQGECVQAVTERNELRALPDADLFALAQSEERAIVTENISDFSAIADGCDRRGEAHFGLILVPPSSYPRGNPKTIGRMVMGLGRVLSERPEQDRTSVRFWL